MRGLLAKLLFTVILINSIFSVSLTSAYADEGTGFTFRWDTEQVLDDTLELVSRGSRYDKALFWFNFGVNNGITFDEGEYKLSYNISDGRRIDVTIAKKAQIATVTYKVWDYAAGAYVGVDDTIYQVYRPATGSYVAPDSETYPNADSSFCVNYDPDTGKPAEVSFNIIRNTGFSFKFNNRTVQFKWAVGSSNDFFYYVTDGMRTGNIYDIDIDLRLSGSTDVTHEELQIFTGVDTDSFTSTPYANDRRGTVTDPIDHTTRPFKDENPGYEPEIELSFNMPRVWNDETYRFDYPDASSMVDRENETSVIIDLSNDSDKKKIQVTIENIYASDIDASTTISSSSGAEVKASVDGNRVNVNITNLQAGTIYNPVEVSLYKPHLATFLSQSSRLALGTVYTYPEFSIVSTASDEFYIKIEPYVGYSGFYTVYSGLTAGTLSKWAQYEDKTGGSASIYLPVDINAINMRTGFFRIEFEITPPNDIPGEEGIKTTSQILKYTPDESDVIIGTPDNLEVTSLDIVHNTTTDKKEMLISLKWDIAYVEVLKNLIKRNEGSLSVDYTFRKGDIPYDPNEERFETVTLTMRLNGDELVVEMTDADGKLESYSITEKIEMIGEDEYRTTVASATFRIPVAALEEKSEQFLYPNVYFINVRGDYYIGNTSYTTAASLPVDITLDDVVDIELPQPQSLEVVEDSVGTTSFTLSWRTLTSGTESSDLYKYNRSMLETLGLSIGEKSLKYNFYISQSKLSLDNLITYDRDRENMPNSITDTISVFDYKDKYPDDGIDLSKEVDGNGKTLRDDLRNGNILKIENVLQNENTTSQSFVLSGLDKNQDYYIIAETAILPYSEDKGDYVIENYDYSNYCKMVTATTGKDAESPSDDENAPAAPASFDKEDVAVSSAKLVWENVHEVADPNSESKLEYQFIRLTGQQMSDKLKEDRLPYSEVWEQLPQNAGKTGWRTNGDNTYMFDGAEFSTEPNDPSKYTYDNINYEKSTIVDHTLSPNQIYFFYIRTVRIVEDEDIAYSVWVPLTLTTTPVQGPYDLEVALEEEHDKEMEVVIGFKLPHMDMTQLGTSYDLRYAIKEDDNAWSDDITMNYDLLTYEEQKDGTIKCYYTIKNLNHGKLYHIKVRLYDRNLGDSSLYSNVVTHRTNLNQDDYEEEHRKNSWIEHYLDLINDIIKEPYWLIEDTSVVTTVVYRPGPFPSLVSGASESVIDLVQGAGGAKKTYYLPGTAIKQAYDANKGFRIKYNDMEVILGPRSIDPTFNDAVIDVKDKIDTGDIDDYFLRVTADFSNVSYQISGENVASPVVNVTVETVGSKKDIDLWDAEMMVKLLEEAMDEDDLEELRKDLDDLIDDREASEDFVKLIKDKISSYKRKFEKKLDSELDKVTKRNYVSLSLSSNMIITFPAKDGAVMKGNRELNGQWLSQDVSDYGLRKAIYTLYPGIYAFTQTVLTIPGLSGNPNETVITNLVSKYGLDDYLGKGGAFNLSSPVSRTEVLGCVARISGAASTDDPAAFLNSKGISNLGRGSQANIAAQEAVYLTMMAYQIRTNTNVETIQIRNYTLTANMNGLTNAYKKSVQAAFETGICANTNMNPNGTMTVNEFLDMLAVLAKKLNLV